MSRGTSFKDGLWIKTIFFAFEYLKMSISPLLLNDNLNGSRRLDWQVCLPCSLRISLHCFQARSGIFILFC